MLRQGKRENKILVIKLGDKKETRSHRVAGEMLGGTFQELDRVGSAARWWGKESFLTICTQG